MLTKSRVKLIKSLHEKKNRSELGLFLVEGEKGTVELLKSNFEIDFLLVTKEFFEKYKDQINKKLVEHEITGRENIEKLGTLESNDSAIAMVKQRDEMEPEIKKDEIIIVLDRIQDPGNLGTIIRVADWYGILKIVCSIDSADFYNSKTISASMGSFTRVEVFYRDLEKFLSEAKEENLPIFGAYLSGEDIHEAIFPTSGILLMGNESKGINKNLEKLVNKKITIPTFGGAESLNVGVATAIILDNWKNNI
jgi:TrmH family RNA methyltransferase